MVDEQTFLREVAAMERTLYRVSIGLLHNRQDCADVVQEALSKAWARRGSAQEQWFRPWLTRIVINECHNHWRRGKRLVVSEKVEPPPEQAAVPNLELRQALDALPEKWRLPLTLHYLEGFSVAEIARITHTAEGTVKSRLHKARAMLKAEWEADEE